ncbi:MAG: ATPase, T2SS/T4P/T4SS family [Pseudomonadota bacterium]
MLSEPDQIGAVPKALLGPGGIDHHDMREIVAAARQAGQPIRVMLDRLGLVQQSSWAAACASETGMPLVALADMPVSLPTDPRLSDSYLQRNAIAPLEIGPNRARFAVADPYNDHAMTGLRMLFGQGLELVVATDRDIEAALARSVEAKAAASGEAMADDLPASGAEIFDFDAERLRELANNAPTVQFLNRLFATAVKARATDIHVEMLGSGPQIRLRIDGELVSAEAPDEAIYQGVVSRLKILAEMDISERRLPQDGRIRQKLAGREVDMRVASTPTVHGESLVLRLLDSSTAPRAMDELEMPDGVLGTFKKALRQPNGLILITGPTGSGKTTTLHAALNAIKTPTRKIMTIEDPVEIQSEGLVQIEVNSELGFTFASALRTILRHNPNILMVGEIRDGETAELAVRAAMTGHLVLSTLHTNRAVDAPLRMVDMGVPDYLLASVLRMSAAQRLVRRLCPHCAAPDETGGGSARAKALLGKIATLDPELGAPDTWHLHRPVGCESCSNTGFRGRLAVYEALDAAELDRVRADKKASYRTMWVEGLRHVAEGRTTLEELINVLGLERLRR